MPTRGTIPTGLALAALAGFTTQVPAQEHEDFDTYATNSQVVGQGGWEERTPGAGAGAGVSAARALSPGHAVELQGAADLVHQLTGYTEGRCVYIARQYVPTGATGRSCFVLLSRYVGGAVDAVRVWFDAANGRVEGDAGGAAAGATTPLVYDRWVELRVVIDLQADWTQVYYDGVLLDDPAVADHPLGGGHRWTAGPDGLGNGPLDIAAVGLRANNASSVFYDELSLERDLGWRDDLDSYPANSSIVGQGGWVEDMVGHGANLTSAQSWGPGQSLAIERRARISRRFWGCDSGLWDLRFRHYVPGDLDSSQTLILYSRYEPITEYAVLIMFDPHTNHMLFRGGGLTQLWRPLVRDRWVQIQVMIDLTADWVQVHYDGRLIDDPALADHPTLGGGYRWSGGTSGSGSAPLNLAALSMDGSTYVPTYYDDFSLRPVEDGVRRYGEPTPGVGGASRIYVLDDATAPSSTFGIACRGGPPPQTVGALAFSIADYPWGRYVEGIHLLVSLTPFVATVPVVTDARRGSVFLQPLAAGWAGWGLYVQYVWHDNAPGAVLSASDALEIKIR
jgi:hypothetical protein